jgi:hypothetical protein
LRLEYRSSRRFLPLLLRLEGVICLAAVVTVPFFSSSLDDGLLLVGSEDKDDDDSSIRFRSFPCFGCFVSFHLPIMTGNNADW